MFHYFTMVFRFRAFHPAACLGGAAVAAPTAVFLVLVAVDLAVDPMAAFLVLVVGLAAVPMAVFLVLVAVGLAAVPMVVVVDVAGAAVSMVLTVCRCNYCTTDIFDILPNRQENDCFD